MATETDIAVIKTKLLGIKSDTTDIKNCLFGNGHKGLKARVTVLEVKFWILIILMTPISCYAVKEMFK